MSITRDANLHCAAPTFLDAQANGVYNQKGGCK